MSKFKLFSSVALAATVLTPAGAHAVDLDPVEECRKDIALQISGQVNRAFLYADNQRVDDTFFVDNDNSSTRIRARATGDVDCDLRVGAQIEVQFESNTSSAIRFDQSGQAGPNNFTKRKLEVWFDSEQWGRLWLGHGNTASDGTSEVDLSKTAVVGYSGIEDMGGGLEFENGVRIGSVFDNFDGLGRVDRVRYDTPIFSGFQFSTSFTDDNEWDIALRFAQSWNGHKFAAAIAYADGDRSQGFCCGYQVNGSASVLFSIGLNLTFAAGVQQNLGTGATQRDAKFVYGKVGWIFDIFDWGYTAIAADVAYNKRVNVAAVPGTGNNDDAWSYGFFAVQRIDWVGTELYAGVRVHELDHNGIVTGPEAGTNFGAIASSDPRNVVAVMTGARVKF